jgi:hypothetical protein
MAEEKSLNTDIDKMDPDGPVRNVLINCRVAQFANTRIDVRPPIIYRNQ